MNKPPSQEQLLILASLGADQVTTYGQEGDDYSIAVDTLFLEDGVLRVDRKIQLHKPVEFISLTISVQVPKRYGDPDE
jgi:hypothetical protein